MGHLIGGHWSTEWYDTKKTGGRFVRAQSGFRNWITADGRAGPTGVGGFAAEAGRYHLYVSLACPWAHRTLIFRKLKNLEPLIDISITDAKMPDETGWSFTGTSGSTGDSLNGKDYLWQIYALADPAYSGRVTVPVLWDKQQGVIVSQQNVDRVHVKLHA